MVRNTIQRTIVLDTVKTLCNHPTADEIYNKISRKHPTISRGTVYRNLNMLSDNGLLLKLDMPDGADRFDHNTHKHYHVKCVHCGIVLDVNSPYLVDINQNIEQETGFTLFDHQIVFKGVCPDCKE